MKGLRDEGIESRNFKRQSLEIYIVYKFSNTLANEMSKHRNTETHNTLSAAQHLAHSANTVTP